VLRHAALDQSPVVLIFFASLSVVSSRISSLEATIGRLVSLQHSKDDDVRSRGSSSNMSSTRPGEVEPFVDSAL
jgi:hypothetical protein